MPEAVINYATYKNSNYSWMLGRFIVPVSRLDEFYESARDFLPRDAKNQWRLSVLASENIFDTVRTIEEFNAANAPGVICDSLEVKATSQEEIVTLTNAIPDTFTTYFELPLTDGLPDLVSTLAINKQCAKIRTGGVTAALFPKQTTLCALCERVLQQMSHLKQLPDCITPFAVLNH